MGILRLIEKSCSLLIAMAYVVAMAIDHHGINRQVTFCSLGLLLPLACIWFPEQLGSCTDIYVGRGQTIDAETPPALVSIMGWILLVALPAFVYFWNSH
jgi:hypothetical protein